LNGNAARYGIIGHPLAHTRSPAMLNALFRHRGMRAFYFPLEIPPERFEEFVPALRLLYRGFNVTVPYKRRILPFLDEVSEAARVIGAVNTVGVRRGRWAGANTDWRGFLDNLQKDHGFAVRGKTVLILGAGGSARACLYALLRAGAGRVHVANRTRARAEELAGSVKRRYRPRVFPGGIASGELDRIVPEADLFVNTTSIGLKREDRHYLDFEKARPQSFAYDLIYSPKTDFLKRASRRGLGVADGGGMLVRQGALAFRWWTGTDPDLPVMERAAGFSGSVS
jgi:shikimate dehydrogenase